MASGECAAAAALDLGEQRAKVKRGLTIRSCKVMTATMRVETGVESGRQASGEPRSCETNWDKKQEAESGNANA